VKVFHNLREFVRAELPGAPFARWASIAFTLSVLAFLISLAAAQALLTASAVCYAVHFWRDRPSVSFPPLKFPLALFCLGTILSVLWGANPTAGWFAVRKLVLFVILLLAANLITSGRHLEWLMKGLFAESALAALVGATQFVLQYRVARAFHPDRIYAFMTSDRITGFMGHWMNFTGQQMLVFGALLAFLLLRTGIRDSGSGVGEEKTSGRWRSAFWWFAFALVALSIVLGFTRGVWLGCGAAVIYLVARRKPRLLWAIPVFALVGYLLAPSMVQRRIQIVTQPRSDPALAIRFEMWAVAVEMMKRHPWLGVGPNSIEQQYVLYLPPGKPPQPGYHAHLHSNFFQLGAERGLPVLASWVWVMAALVYFIGRLRKGLARRRWVADAALAGWLAFVLEGCFEFNFGTSPVLMLFLLMMALPFAAARIDRTAGIEPTVDS